MKIKAEIRKVFTDSSRVKAVATLTLDDVFIVRNVRLVEGSKGLFVSMPSFKNASGNFKDICFPINGGMREQIQAEVMAAYKAKLAESDTVSGDDDTEQETA